MRDLGGPAPGTPIEGRAAGRPDVLGRLLGQPPIVWVLLGALVAYAAFVRRVFLNDSHVMALDPYVPRLDAIGNDLRLTLQYGQMLFTDRSPYEIDPPIPFPPLGLDMLLPLASLRFPVAYALVVVLTLVAFVTITLVVPSRLLRHRGLSAVSVLLLVTGAVSYGLHFELERGQFNVIAVALCFVAAYLYHARHPSRGARMAAYALFVLAVQLKIYPAVFVLAFVRRADGAARNVARMVTLLLANAPLIFVLGPAFGLSLVKVTVFYSLEPYVWVGNHSIKAFAALTGTPPWPYALVLLAACAVVAVIGWREHWDGDHPFLLSTLTVTALLVPSSSHDYTLAVLPAAGVLLLDRDAQLEDPAGAPSLICGRPVVRTGSGPVSQPGECGAERLASAAAGAARTRYSLGPKARSRPRPGRRER